jgi:hypothetical protein
MKKEDHNRQYLTVGLPKEYFEFIQMLAKQEDRSVSKYAEIIIKKHLDGAKK